MSTTTSIFSFDHGQKKLNKAIGVTEEFMDDLQEHIAETLKNHIFDEDRNIKDDLSPSLLVEVCLHNFSYNQLILMSSFFLQTKLDDLAEKMNSRLKSVVKKIALDADKLPPNIKELLMKMTEEDKTGGPINGDDLPQELKDFLDDVAKRQDGDGDDD
jgi:gas vesicle protein